jgi:uncharacterized protein YeaC (DUF1315 family)
MRYLTRRTPWIEIAMWIMDSRPGQGSALAYAKDTTPEAYEAVQAAVRVFDRWLDGIHHPEENWETVVHQIIAAEEAARLSAERASQESDPEASELERRAEKVAVLVVLLVGLGMAAQAHTAEEARQIGGNTIGRWLAAYPD